jgi:GT2 family glycosyltransferase
VTVDVVIPVYGQWELTERCLASLRARDACVRRIIVVDDASPDETAQRLRERDDVEAVLLPVNGGFAAACNAGARRSDADAVFFLNNDTLVTPGTIDRLAAALDDDRVGAVMPKLLNGDGTVQCTSLTLLAGSDRFQRMHAYLDADLPAVNYGYDPLALMGAALLVRRSALVAAGFFDERYRNGSEDTDLCVRLWKLGYRCRYEPRAALLHLEGASRGKIVGGDENQRRFSAAWHDALVDAPRWDEPPAPALALRWHSLCPLDRAVGALWTTILRGYAGARVTRAPLVAPLLAALDRRPLLRIGHAAGGTSDVRWCAPEDELHADAMADRDASLRWVPSHAAAALLEAAGVGRRRIAVTRLGWPPAQLDGERREVLLVARDPTVAATLARRIGAIPLVTARLDAAALQRLRGALVVAFADGGDGWCAAGGAALSGGACVVAPPDAPFLELAPADAFVAARSATVADAARACAADAAAARERGAYAARMAARLHPDVNAGRRVRELARGFVYGVPDPRRFAFDGLFADGATGASA